MVTRPDGMWFRVCSDDEAVDVICIEICGTLQNLWDKRSRYIPTISAIVLEIEWSWLHEKIYKNLNRKQKSGIGLNESSKQLKLGVRYLRVIFALTTEDYNKFRKDGVPAGHEYFLKHSSLASFSSPKMQEFLRRLAPMSHFYSAT